MPFGEVRLIPGINTERTPTLNQTGFVTSQLIRWKDKLVQKIDGWVRWYPYALAGNVRRIWGWQDLNINTWLAVGTTTNLTVVSNNVATNITPQIVTFSSAVNFSTVSTTPTVTIIDAGVSNPTTYDVIYIQTPIAVGGLILSGAYQIQTLISPTSYTITAANNATGTINNGGAVPTFTTVSGSAIVTVVITGHGLAVGNQIALPVSTTVGGLTILGTYTVITVTDANTFTISASSQASSSAGPTSMNGGNGSIAYYITAGPLAASQGWGFSTWGSGGWGQGTTGSSQTGTPIAPVDWSLDNWGPVLIACPTNGALYTWQPNGGFPTASMIANGPLFNTGAFVSQPAQILVAYGSTKALGVGVAQDPLFVKWSDQLDYTTWTAAITNQAGSYRIPTGSTIVGGMQSPNTTLLWTDLDVYGMQYLGPPLVFGFNKLGSNCGLIAKNACVANGSNVYWMSQSNFFVMAGSGVTAMPCSVWDAVFENLNLSFLANCWAWSNQSYGEIWWFYPSTASSSGQCDSYVKYNIIEQAWDYGQLPRAAGIDQSVLGSPIAASTMGVIYQHETGFDGDGSPIAWSYQTGYFTIAQGEQIAFVDKIIPDFIFKNYGGGPNATISMTFYGVNYPGDTPTAYGPYTVTSTTQQLVTRIRAREIAITVSGSDLGTFSRLGLIRYRYAPDGSR